MSLVSALTNWARRGRRHAPIPTPPDAVKAQAKAAAAARDLELNTLYASALAHYKAGEMEAAVEQFGKVAEMAPRRTLRHRQSLYYRIQALGFNRGDHAAALPLCEELTREFPDYWDGWQLLGRVRVELGQPVQALHAFKRALRIEPDGRTFYELAKILDRAQRRAMAVQTAVAARAAGVTPNFLHLILASNLIYLGQHERAAEYLALLRQAGSSPSHVAFLDGMVEKAARTRAYLAAHPDQTPARHITIGGANYVGSTLLGLLLGSLPGVAFTGETQDLTHRWDAQSGAPKTIDFGRDHRRLYSHCRTCGHDCAVLDHAFRQALIADPVEVYDKVARQLGVRTLVTSDKTFTRLTAADPLFRFDLIILYKNPDTWARSQARQQAALVADGLQAPERVGTPRDWLRQWSNTYEDLLRMPIPEARRVVINWDRFAQAPARHFERLLARLGLSGDAAVFEALTPGHLIGGNATDNLTDVLTNRRVVFKPSDAPPLPPALAQEVMDQGRAWAIARRLERRYQEAFGSRPQVEQGAAA